jgi:DNA-directed RNA polymerase subunit alpha
MPVALDLTGLVLPEAVEHNVDENNERRAEFVLQPLERGFGHTIGNSIRRILLSSLPGAAIWAFRADGVQHEHQTIDGVAEDIHQIIQNLKRLVFELDPAVEEAKLDLAVHSSGVVKASAIEKQGGVDIVNPDQSLFTLQEDLPENRPLRLQLWANRGRGFVMAEHHTLPEGAPVDLIRIDSIYNPVIRANFTVQETRVGQRTDFDRLTIDIETDGSLTPADAIACAAQIAEVHLRYLAHFGDVSAIGIHDGNGAEEPGRRKVGDELLELLDQPLEAFDEISVRSRNTLDKAGIRTLGDLATRTRDEILNVANFGEKSLEEVAEVLALNRLRFGMEIERDDIGNLYIREEGAGGNGAGGDGTEDDEA